MFRWFKYAIRTPSRAIPLAIIALDFIVIFARGVDSQPPSSGLSGVLNFVAGALLIGVLLSWRVFWAGPAVQRKRADIEGR